jgi:hypothetical protein
MRIREGWGEKSKGEMEVTLPSPNRLTVQTAPMCHTCVTILVCALATAALTWSPSSESSSPTFLQNPREKYSTRHPREARNPRGKTLRIVWNTEQGTPVWNTRNPRGEHTEQGTPEGNILNKEPQRGTY